MVKGRTETYNTTEILTAKKVKLVVMLYDGAIRFGEESIKRIENKDIEGGGIFIGKAQRIVLELLNVLDMENGGEIAKNLERLYTYVNRNLTLANIKKEVSFVKDSLMVLKDLREGWKELSENNAKEVVVERNYEKESMFKQNITPSSAPVFSKLALQA